MNKHGLKLRVVLRGLDILVVIEKSGINSIQTSLPIRCQMKLAAKLVSTIVFGIIIILAIDGYFTVRHDIGLFEADMKRNADLLGRAMKSSVTDVWFTRGEQRALKLISGVNEGEHRLYVRWVWLNVPPDDPYSPVYLGKARYGDTGTGGVLHTTI